jgi:signal transduction histidine kinase
MMDELQLLRGIRDIWLNRVTQEMARGSGLRQNLRDQLEDFFNRLEQALDTGEQAWLNPVLENWAIALTETDLENNLSELVIFVQELMMTTYRVCGEALSEDEAMRLFGALLPSFSHAFQRSAQYETQAKVIYITHQLDEVRLTLEQLDKRKSDFIAVAAHELRTPLTLLDGYASMLRESLEQRKASQVEMGLLNGISSGTRRLHTIVEDMLDVSLIDNNLMELTFQPVWFNRLFTALRNEFGKIVAERNQSLEFKEFDGSSEMTFGDPARLLQVFRNLLSNAVKFTPDGGKIWVDGRKLPGFIEITTSDTGIGIAMEDQESIFEKFSSLGDISLHSTGPTKFKGGGPGLGLHICKGIVEAHGGAIWVESTGCDEHACPGSTFHVLLPLLSEPPDDKLARLFADEKP